MRGTAAGSTIETQRPEEADMHWNLFAIVYMTTFFGLVLGTVVYAFIHLLRGSER